MTLLRDVIHIPERSYGGEFVLKLTEGVADVERTINDYVVTSRLARNFDEALGFIQDAVTSGRSMAAYLHGSFGAGKSHFMAVLHALLRKEPAARGRAELANVVARHDSWLAARRFLLVPYHLIGAHSLESAVLGGYVKHVRELHPEAPIPAVHQTDGLIENARRLRGELGDERFIAGLPRQVDGGWGTLGAKPPWTSAELDAAMSEPHGGERRTRLVNDLAQSWATGWLETVTSEATGYISLDAGLAEISAHAKSMGYDAVVLFLDELVLWLASRIADMEFVTNEASKVSKFVEAGDARRQVPIISFIARQRNLAELVGEATAGSELVSLYDVLKYWEGRFGQITLDNTNLPEIVRQRLLKPVNAEASIKIDEAFAQTRRLQAAVWDTLLGSDGSTGSDIEAFRATYPFSPAFMDSLVAVSGALQRERTALTLMQKILVDRRDDLRLGELVPLGDLYDALASGNDQPFTERLKVEYENARKFYTTKLRPYVRDSHGGLTETDIESRAGDPARLRAFRGDDRLVKTLLLSALVPQVPALRNLTASRLAALNHGSIISPIPGGELQAVAAKVKEWAGRFGEVKYADADDPGVGLELVGVDVDSVLANVVTADTPGDRRRKIKEILWSELGVSYADELLTTHRVVWRGTRRPIELVFGNVRDEDDIRDERFSPDSLDAWLLVIDYPFDEGNHGPSDDRGRVQKLAARGEERVVCWIPAFLSEDRKADLGRLVRLDYLLGGSGNRFEENAQHLSPADRSRARSVLSSQREVLHGRLRDVLKQAYGLAKPQTGDVGDYDDHLLSLASGLRLTLPIGARFADTLINLVGQMYSHSYPDHPDLDPDREGTAVRTTDLQVVLDVVSMAAQRRDRRVEVERPRRKIVRRIANPLQLGEMHEAAFVLGSHWQQEIDRWTAQERTEGDLRVSAIRGRLAPRGFDSDVANLIIASYAAIADRTWVWHGGPVEPPPKLTKITTDMALRQPATPDEATWLAATERAEAIFGIPAPPLCSGRTTAELAGKVRARAREQVDDTRRLVEKLEANAEVLGIDRDAPTGRLATARLAQRLLEALDETDDIAVLRTLAAADLTVAPAILGRSVSSAGDLLAAFRLTDWNNLRLIRQLGEDKRSQADGILNALRDAAREDEFAHPLTDALTEASRSAAKLVQTAVTERELRKTQEKRERELQGATTRAGETISRRTPATNVAAVLDEIRSFAAEHPDETIEISWQAIDDA